MKKTLFGLSIVLLLAGCGAVEEEAIAEDTVDKELRYTPDVWTDKETGCDYLIIETGSRQGGVSITPRMNAEGTQTCF